jgi:hypothetical protein
MQPPKVPRSWKDLNEHLWAHSFDDRSSSHRPYIAYRGLPEHYNNLLTGIQRLGDSADRKWRERRIIETFSVYAREHLPREPTDWDILFLGQHYRLPTRLLDWTASPYVALRNSAIESAQNRFAMPIRLQNAAMNAWTVRVAHSAQPALKH